jgi:hypothetical protein
MLPKASALPTTIDETDSVFQNDLSERNLLAIVRIFRIMKHIAYLPDMEIKAAERFLQTSGTQKLPCSHFHISTDHGKADAAVLMYYRLFYRATIW